MAPLAIQKLTLVVTPTTNKPANPHTLIDEQNGSFPMIYLEWLQLEHYRISGVVVVGGGDDGI